MAKQPLVTVYNPEGKPEKHSAANGRDLVNGSGYTWQPLKETTPAAYAPFRKTTPPTPKEPAQAVLDGAGHKTDRTINDVVDFEADEEVVDMTAGSGVAVADEDVPVFVPGKPSPAAPAPAPAAEPAAAADEDEAPRRGRGRRKADDAE